MDGCCGSRNLQQEQEILMLDSTFHSVLDFQDKTMAMDFHQRQSFEDNFFMDDSAFF